MRAMANILEKWLILFLSCVIRKYLYIQLISNSLWTRLSVQLMFLLGPPHALLHEFMAFSLWEFFLQTAVFAGPFISLSYSLHLTLDKSQWL